MKTLITLLSIVILSGFIYDTLNFVSPLKDGSKIVSKYGERFHPITQEKRFHAGIDYRVPEGTKVYAAASGIVTFTGIKEKNGITIVLKHSSGFETHYFHLSKSVRGLEAGHRISSGQHIGFSGKSGLTYAPILHFEIRKNGNAVNPDNYLQH